MTQAAIAAARAAAEAADAGQPVPSQVLSTAGRAASGGRDQGVANAARLALPDIDSDHAAAAVLQAMAIRYAQDVDEATQVRDRVAAGRALIEVLRELDGGAAPPGRPPVGIPIEQEDDERDGNPFGIPELPPALGDTA